MFSDFMLRAMFIYLVLSLITAPLGAISIWKRMSYFGDAASHGALLGVALAIVSGIQPMFGAGLIAIFMGLYLGLSETRRNNSDAVLGVIAHGGLATALLIGAASSRLRGSFEGYLFGDILAVSSQEVMTLIFVTSIILAITIWRWKRILIVTLNPELAAAQGINPRIENLLFVLLLAATVAIAMKVVGALLVGALLVIPAFTARRLSNSPEQMVLMAFVISVISGIVGFVSSYYADYSTGPSIVVAAFTFYIVVQFATLLRNREN